MVLNIIVTGVGGQGILSLARVIGEAIIQSSDLNVSIAETHGLSQRGGSVITYVRISKDVTAPTIDYGEADIMLSMELIEAARYANYLRVKDSIAIINDKLIRPSIPKVKVPDRSTLLNIIRSRTNRVYVVNASEEALKRGSPLSANMMLFGFISVVLEKLGIVSIDKALNIVSNLSKSEIINRVNRELYILGYNEGLRSMDYYIIAFLKKKLSY